MELNTRGRYAVMAMADIACQDSSAAHALSAIAERQKLPLAYLEQLFVQLRRAGLVDSARGRSGGYRLAHPAAQISVADVMSHRPITCGPRDRLADLMAVMTEHRVRHLPVVEDGQLIGLVSIGDLVKARLGELEFESNVLRDAYLRVR